MVIRPAVGHTVLNNRVLWDNTAPLGPEIALIGDFPAELTVSYSDVEGGEAGVFVQSGFILNWGAGNIDRDPQFVEPGSGDYRLAAGSSCIDAGHNWGVPADGTDLDSDGDTSELTPLDLGDPPFMIRKLSRRTFEAIRGMGEQQPLSIGTLEKRLASTWVSAVARRRMRPESEKKEDR